MMKIVVIPGMNGFDFHREIRHFEEIVVEVYDNLLAPDDRFIKELYRTFTKYI